METVTTMALGGLSFCLSPNGLEVETCGLIFRFTERAFALAWIKMMAAG